MIEYKIIRKVYDNIINGIKKVEIRLLNEKSSKIKIDDIIKFTVLDDEKSFVLVKVVNLYYYNDIDELWDKKNYIILDEETSKDEVKKLMNSIYGEEQVNSHKIIGIEFIIL